MGCVHFFFKCTIVASLRDLVALTGIPVTDTARIASSFFGLDLLARFNSAKDMLLSLSAFGA